MSQTSRGSKTFIAAENLEAFRRVKLGSGSGPEKKCHRHQTEKVVSWVKASKVTSDLWKFLKSEYPEKFKNIHRDIKAFGIQKITIGFSKYLKPSQGLIKI